MSLLREIQASLMEQGQDIGPILLKLRFLASRLGSGLLEEWVKFESDGYPSSIEVPEYRKIGIAYKADFSGPFGAGIKNAPIPSYLIHEYAGESWNSYEIRQSISGIESLAKASDDAKTNLHIDASNLILLLQGKVYQGYNCISVTGSISAMAFVEIQSAVRARVLELTLELEKAVPAAAEIGLGGGAKAISEGSDKVSSITNTIIHGNLNNISNLGAGAHFNVQINQADSDAFAKALTAAGIAESDAKELATIVASEKPESVAEPFGPKAKAWIGKNIGKAVSGTWKAGVAVATSVITEAALKYYGLK